MITETTISGFSGFDPNGMPEFVRARKAMQYSASIDDYARIMKDGNNGGYANNWLVADRKTNEVASLELGLKNVIAAADQGRVLRRARTSPPIPKLTKEETDFDLNDKSLSQNARHARWLTLMEQNKGKIDVAAGQKFLADHFDTFDGKARPASARCAATSKLSPRGMGTWQPPYAPAGAVQNKITDAAGAEKMTLKAAAGARVRANFKAPEHLAKHQSSPGCATFCAICRRAAWAKFTAK